ncbi:hypothetical protein CCACVL1_29383 [Corchorus capsularis]|uniref:Uncharacterized protein n=1 Tax=Corchorus capsularis TaxID=210143 RepID=A0A1R3G1U5_COCAP|nr:hypothetical protein CCACVL1_29383 [Corchorus capsularis]
MDLLLSRKEEKSHARLQNQRIEESSQERVYLLSCQVVIGIFVLHINNLEEQGKKDT